MVQDLRELLVLLVFRVFKVDKDLLVQQVLDYKDSKDLQVFKDSLVLDFREHKVLLVQVIRLLIVLMRL